MPGCTGRFADSGPGRSRSTVNAGAPRRPAPVRITPRSTPARRCRRANGLERAWKPHLHPDRGRRDRRGQFDNCTWPWRQPDSPNRASAEPTGRLLLAAPGCKPTPPAAWSGARRVLRAGPAGPRNLRWLRSVKCMSRLSSLAVVIVVVRRASLDRFHRVGRMALLARRDRAPAGRRVTRDPEPWPGKCSTLMPLTTARSSSPGNSRRPWTSCSTTPGRYVPWSPSYTSSRCRSSRLARQSDPAVTVASDTRRVGVT
jgi:hypothetical protein